MIPNEAGRQLMSRPVQNAPKPPQTRVIVSLSIQVPCGTLPFKAEAVKLRLLVKRQSVKSSALTEFNTWHV